MTYFRDIRDISLTPIDITDLLALLYQQVGK
jgi:hypothetical protein